MSKSNRFWLGVALGALGGVWIAQRTSPIPRMPNAKIWQRILTEKLGPVEAAVFMGRVQQRYSELKARRPIFENAVFNTHVVGNILPGLALYEVQREDGLESDAALTEINALFEAWFNQYPPPNMRIVCPESYRLLVGGSPILVMDRQPGSRHPVQSGDWLC